MKKYFALLIFVFLFFQTLNAQISITTSDLPHANDTFRISSAQVISGIDLALTGPAYNWDFSQLAPVSQQVDSFIDESATNPVFSIVYIDNMLNPNRANQATPGFSFNLGTFLSLTDVYNFYYNSSASYKQVGLGATINGIPLPITYSPHDVILKLPLQFGALDSSDSGYEIDLTSTLGLYYKVQKSRKNEADGWGTLATPYGIFDVLRVHSTVIQQDSVYIDSLGFGINFPARTSHEYKWLGAGQGLPLLQINTSSTGSITQILYKDSLRSLVGIGEMEVLPQTISVFPNPATETTTFCYELRSNANVELTVISMDGKVISCINNETQLPGKHKFVFDINARRLTSGNYFFRLHVNGRSYLQPFVVAAY